MQHPNTQSKGNGKSNTCNAEDPNDAGHALVVLPASVLSVDLTCMVDSGAMHNFISETQLAAIEHAHRSMHLWHWIAMPLEISLADNTIMQSGKQVTLPICFGNDM